MSKKFLNEIQKKPEKEKIKETIRKMAVSLNSFNVECIMNDELKKKFEQDPFPYLKNQVGCKFMGYNDDPAKRRNLIKIVLDPNVNRWCAIWIFFREPIIEGDKQIWAMKYDEAVDFKHVDKPKWKRVDNNLVLDGPISIPIDLDSFDSTDHEIKQGVSFSFHTFDELPQNEKGVTVRDREIRDLLTKDNDFPFKEKFTEIFSIPNGKSNAVWLKQETGDLVLKSVIPKKLDEVFVYIQFPFLDVDKDPYGVYKIDTDAEIVLTPCS